jgi:hypothetical protein
MVPSAAMPAEQGHRIMWGRAQSGFPGRPRRPAALVNPPRRRHTHHLYETTGWCHVGHSPHSIRSPVSMAKFQSPLVAMKSPHPSVCFQVVVGLVGPPFWRASRMR